MIDKKSKIFFIVFFSITIIFVLFTYYKYILLNDFEIFTDEELFNESLIDY